MRLQRDRGRACRLPHHAPALALRLQKMLHRHGEKARELVKMLRLRQLPPQEISDRHMGDADGFGQPGVVNAALAHLRAQPVREV